MVGTNSNIAIAAINIIIESLQENDFFNIVYVCRSFHFFTLMFIAWQLDKNLMVKVRRFDDKS